MQSLSFWVAIWRRQMDWQRSAVLPLQEMFGQVGIGRFWEANPRFPDAMAVTGRDLDNMASRRSFEYRRTHPLEPRQDILSLRRCKSRSL